MSNTRFSRRLLGVAFALMLPVAASASSHREAPLITEDPTVDNTDVYAFRSPDAPNTVTFIANYSPLSEPGNGPNFYNFSPSAIYEIHIDNNGDAREDITYQFQFRTEQRGDSSHYNTAPITSLDDADWFYRQFYSVTRIAGDRRTGTRTSLGTNFRVPPANIGPKSTPDYPALANAAIADLPSNGGKVFAGPRDDSFFIDFSVFDLLTLRPIQQLSLIPPMASSAPGVDGLRGYNVQSIAIQVPISSVTADGSTPTGPTSGNAIIGVWATASRSRLTIRSVGSRQIQNVSGSTQVSRLGSPLVNEVVVPTRLKDVFNASHPSGDAAFLPKVQDPELSKLLKVIYNIDSPPAPRADLVSVFLTGLAGANMPPNVTPSEQLRLNLGVPVTASPNRLAAIAAPTPDLGGYPNGRRLTDDIPDIALRVVAGILVPAFNRPPNNALSDGVDTNDKPFLSTFPYIALPHQGFDSRGRSQNP